MEQLTKFTELNEFADLLLKNGFQVIICDLRDNNLPTWFNFSKDNQIGYVQYEKHRGGRFSTVHKPCRECGTGYALQDQFESTDLTIENAMSTFIVAPNWAKRLDVNAIKKYASAEEFVKGERVLNYRIIQPINA